MILLSSNALAQTDNHFLFEKNIPGKFNDIFVDALENIYVITPDFQLIKMNSDGAILSNFNDVKKYGTPSFIDVSNPLKNLIYYKSYGIIVTLDKLLIVFIIVSLSLVSFLKLSETNIFKFVKLGR
jgi:hypothetical protein